MLLIAQHDFYVFFFFMMHVLTDAAYSLKHTVLVLVMCFLLFFQFYPPALTIPHTNHQENPLSSSSAPLAGGLVVPPPPTEEMTCTIHVSTECEDVSWVEQERTEKRHRSHGGLLQGGRSLPANCVFLALWLSVIWPRGLCSAGTAATEKSAETWESKATTTRSVQDLLFLKNMNLQRLIF